MTELHKRKHQISRGKGYCSYCNQKLQKSNSKSHLRSTVDHQIPISRGGKDTVENIVPACMRCNKAKDNMNVQEFINHVILIYNFMTKGE